MLTTTECMHSGLLIFAIHVLQNSSKRDMCSIYNHHIIIIIVCTFYYITRVRVEDYNKYYTSLCISVVLFFFFFFKPQCYFRSS